MHKYQPRIHIIKRGIENSSGQVTNLEAEEYRSFVFPETLFIAVTAYQNQLVSIPKFLYKISIIFLACCYQIYEISFKIIIIR